ncbi:hypothetical protein EA438_10045 [Streptococcus dysgalactiae subsp. dysgalactiae]|nr:hypothetical protein [Streptococcus dysgalactiae subsp. dysgalactiae]
MKSGRKPRLEQTVLPVAPSWGCKNLGGCNPWKLYAWGSRLVVRGDPSRNTTQQRGPTPGEAVPWW